MTEKLSDYEVVLKRILLTLEEAYRAERMFHCAVEKGEFALRSIYKSDLFKGLNAIFSSLGFNFSVAVQRLLQGDDKATLSGLLKQARKMLSEEDYIKMKKALDALRSSQNAEKLKEVRDSFLAHNDLNIADKTSTLLTQDMLDLLFDMSKWIEELNKLVGYDQYDVYKGYDKYHDIADLTWEALDIENIHKKQKKVS